MTTVKKLVIAIVALSVILCCAIGGTLAYLWDKTDPVTNVFTYGDINITLAESEGLDLKMIPGKTITKDPYITVDSESEACYLFVKIDVATDLASMITYDLADGWTALTGEEGVYYMTLDSIPAGKIYVLADNAVYVDEDVTKEELRAAGTLTMDFTAYAVQNAYVATVAEAWNIANGN